MLLPDPLLASVPAVLGPGADARVERVAEQVCDDGGGLVCEQIYEWTGNESLAEWTGWLLGRPLKILLVVVLAWILVKVLNRAIDRGMDRVRRTALGVDAASGVPISLDAGTRARVEQRTRTLAVVLKSLAKLVVWVLTGLVVLGELGISLGPLVAGAGIAGIALGFGAQTIVRDFLSGIFIIVEDQYGVGDIVDVGEASGTIERVTLRTTVLRDVYGTVWYVPNGEITRAGNKSQLWANALLDIGVAYEADVDRASQVIADAARGLYEDPEWSGSILEPPEVLGVQDLAADAVTIRVSVRTEPASQFEVERELRRRIKVAFDSDGIEIPFPQRTVWVRREDAVEAAGPPEEEPR